MSKSIELAPRWWDAYIHPITGQVSETLKGQKLIDSSKLRTQYLNDL